MAKEIANKFDVSIKNVHNALRKLRNPKSMHYDPRIRAEQGHCSMMVENYILGYEYKSNVQVLYVWFEE